jgi:hypothetical protein
VEGEHALHQAVAVGIQRSEVLAEPVAELGRARTEARAPETHGHDVRDAPEGHVAAGSKCAQRELVSDRERVVDVQAAAEPVFAGEAVAVVVEIDIAAEKPHAAIDVHAQVGRADGLARADLGGDDRGRQVVDEQQRLLEPGLGDDVARLQVLAQDAGEQPLGEARRRPAL